MDYYVFFLFSKEKNEYEFYKQESLFKLYRLFLNAKNIVNIEYNLTDDNKHCEIRVVFRCEELYQELYLQHKNILDSLEQEFVNFNTTFKLTNSNSYTSQFANTYYPPENEIIDWTLIKNYKQWFIEHILPIGTLKTYKGNGSFEKVSYALCRFNKERTSSIERLYLSKRSMEYYPPLLNYTFDHIVEYLILKNPLLYYKFRKLCIDTEKYMEQYVLSCETSTIVIGHQSYNTGFKPHVHRLGEESKYTLTMAHRITFEDPNPGVYEFYQPFDDATPDIEKFFGSQDSESFIETYIKDKDPIRFSGEKRSSFLLFNAAYTPHGVSYNNDINIYFIYDNCQLKDGAKDIIKNKAKFKHFENVKNNCELYFYDL